jgi:hypothetical protein
MKNKAIVNALIVLIEQNQNLFFESCCKIISEGMKVTAQIKFQTLSTIDLNVELQSYSQEEIESLKLVILYLRSTKAGLFAIIKTAEGVENIELYTSVVKEMLLSFGFLLLEDVGFELIEIMISALESKNLKLSYSTFQFWLDFCEKWSKSKVEQGLQEKIWKIIDYLFSVILQKIKMESESTLF